MLTNKKKIALSSILNIDDVEYIEPSYAVNTRMQYADAGVKVDWSKNFTIKGVTSTVGSHRSVIFGNYVGDNASYAMSLEWTAQRTLRAYLDPVNSAGIVTTNIIVSNVFDSEEIALFEFNWYAATGKAVFSVRNLDGSKAGTQTATTSPIRNQVSTKTFLIGKDYRTATSSVFNGKFRLYKLEYIENDQLKARWMPMCRNKTPFLYEQVSDACLYTNGGGYFDTGRKIREVEYLGFSGTQRFNSLFKPNTLSTTLKTTFEINSQSLSRFPFGVRKISGYGDSCAMYIAPVVSGSPYGYLRLDWPMKSATKYSFTSETQKITLEATGNYVNVNGIEYTSSDVTSYDQPAPFYIGNCYTTNSGAFQSAFVGKYYCVQLLNTTTREPYRDYIPAIDENGVAFLFDKVSHAVFLPETGTITEYGRRIKRVNCLVSSGTQYIDTGVYMKQNYGVDINVKQAASSSGTARYLFGDYTNSSAAYMLGLIPAGVYICDFKQYSNRITTDFSGYDGKFHTHKIINGSYYIDGVLQGTVSPSEFTAQGHAWLFGVKNRGTSGSYWQIKSTALTDENNNKLVEYIPAKDENGVGFMFDVTSHTIFDNAGTGKFGAGNLVLPKYELLPDGFTRFNYLKSTSAQYINTLIAGGNDNLEISIDFKYSTFISFGAIYGNWASDSYNVTRLQLWDGGVLGTDVCNLNTLSSDAGNQYTSSIGANVLHHVVSNKNSITIDGVEITRTKLTSGTANNANICLFNRSLSSPNTTRNIGLEVYAFKVRDNGKLIANFIPAVRNKDNKPGMYDVVTGIFFTNVGSGEFTYG